MRHATEADIPTATTVLARAFQDDPVQQWLFPDEHRRPRRLARVFAAELGHFVDGGHTLVATPPDEDADDDIGSVAIWAPGDRWRPPLLTVLRLLAAHASAIGPRAVAGLRLLREMDRTHPTEPHWYLAVLGTSPDHQGRGLASAVLAPVLETCDTEGLPAYLESSNQANVPFYERHGFRVVGEIADRGAPPVQRMWRAPS